MATRWFKWVLVMSLSVSTGVSQDASYPVPDADPWSIADAAQETSAARHRICLNGYWQFWPAGDPLPKPDTGWCWQKVPGSWPASHRWGLFPYPFEPLLSETWARKLSVDPGRGNWQSRNDKTGEPIAFDSVTKAWYQRRFSMPESWSGKRVVLSAEFVERKAYVLVDGVHCGNIIWPHGELDITEHLTAGKPATISILVASTTGGVRGLAGDVWVEARPDGPWLDEVYLIPSVQHSALTIRGVVRNAGQDAAFQLAGRADLNDLEVFTIAPRTARTEAGRFELTVPWPDAARWDFDHPRIHQVRISLHDTNGTLLDETLPIRLGFREFSIDGRDFRLNGVPVHFRATFYKPVGASTGLADEATVRRVVGRLRARGYNLLVGSNYSSGPGQLHYPRQFLETCDSMGMAVQLQLNKATQFMTHTEEDGWQLPPEALEQWKQAVRPQLLRQRQHPSLFFWASNANIFAGPEKANPHGWALPERPTQRMPGWDDFTGILEVSDDYIKEMDGTRPVISLGNGNFRDVISSYVYPNFYPRQEQRELPSKWAESGLKPLMIAEWGNPADISFSSHRDSKPQWGSVGDHAEPMPVEYSAIFDGDQAYALDSGGVSLYQRLDQLHAQPFSIYHWTRRHAFRFGMHRSFFKTKIDAMREVMPVWRAYGVSDIGILESYRHRQTVDPGIDHWPNPDRWTDLKSPGVKPDNHVWYEAELTHPEAEKFFELTDHGRAWQEVCAPVLCLIGGHPDQDGGIANRAGNVVTDGRLQSSMIVVNDTLSPLQLACTWRLKQGASVLAVGEAQLQAPAGGRAVHPLVMTVPATPGGLLLEARFQEGDDEWLATRHWHVLPAATGRQLSGIALYDPAGPTAESFERLRVPFEKVESRAPLPDACRLLVIGQAALDTETDLPLVNHAAESGTAILLLAQNSQVVSERLGFRYTDVVARRMTARLPGAPELSGLNTATLQNWCGAGTLLPARPDMTAAHHYSGPVVDWLGFKTNRFYHWGNTGSVASILLEKPDVAGFDVIVDGSADMRYAGLLRARDGRCRITLCQLDLVARSVPDPAADRLLVNLLEVEASAGGQQAQPLAPLSIGGKAKGWLDALQIEAQPITAFSKIPTDAVAVLGPDAVTGGGDLAELAERVEQGLHLLAIGWSEDAMSQLAGMAIHTESRKLVYEPPLSGLPEALAGIGPADLFWHGPIKCETITAIHEPKVATMNTAVYWTPFGTIGQVRRSHGQIVFLQPTPDDVEYEWQSHARSKILRVIGIVLSNWNVSAPAGRLLHDLSTSPAADEKRWDAGYYATPATLKDDVFRWRSW